MGKPLPTLSLFSSEITMSKLGGKFGPKGWWHTFHPSQMKILEKKGQKN